MVKKLTQAQRLEQEVAGIREALNSIMKNHLPSLDKRVLRVEERGKFHTTLILGVYGATFAGALAIILALVVVK